MTGDFWIVRMPDGTEARLGYETYSEQVMYWVCGEEFEKGNFVGYGADEDNPHYAVKRWQVDTITDPFGNNMLFTYTEYKHKLIGESSDAYSLLREIKYNQDSSENYLSRVWFGIDASHLEWDEDDNYKLKPSVGPLYTEVQVKDGSPQQLVRRYEFSTEINEATNCSNLKVAYLASIQMFGAGDQALPPTTLGYHWLDNWNPDENDSDKYLYPRLGWVENGYGGRTLFGYDEGDKYYHTNDGSCPYSGDPKSVGQTYSVIGTWTYDGLGGSPSHVTYEYGNYCRGIRDAVCARADAEARGTIVGYDWTTERVYDYDGTLLAVNYHDFLVEYALLGREDLTIRKDAAETPLLETDTTWSAETMDPTTWSRADQVVTTEYGGDTISTMVEYEYDPVKQGGVQYGNMTAEYHHGNIAVTGDERSVHRVHYPNDNPLVWIVNKVARETVYRDIRPDDDNLNYLESRTRYRYDDQSCWDLPPLDDGELTALDRWNGSTGGDPANCYAEDYDTAIPGGSAKS